MIYNLKLRLKNIKKYVDIIYKYNINDLYMRSMWNNTR